MPFRLEIVLTEAADPDPDPEPSLRIGDRKTTPLERWVKHCIGEGVQELDTMIVTAPSDLKQAFACYDSMADEVECVISRFWMKITATRLLRLH